MSVQVFGGKGKYSANERHVVITDTTTPRDGSATAIVHCHGRNASFADMGAGAAELSEQVLTTGFRRALWRAADLGMPVGCADLGGPAPWGNPTSRQRVLALHSFMVTSFGVNPNRLLLSGVSMGAVTSFNAARENTTLVKGIVGFYPCMDMTQAALSSYVPEQETAYGGAAARTSALPTSNPNQYASGFTIPSLLLYSLVDALCVPATIDTWQSTATNATKRAIAGDPPHNGAINDTDITAVTDFFRTYR